MWGIIFSHWVNLKLALQFHALYRDDIVPLTSSHRMPYKPANICWDGRSASVLTRIPFFCKFGREPCQHAPRGVTLCGMMCIHTQVFLGDRRDTVRWPRTKGTAVNEWVHSFVDFCLPFIHDLFLWRTSQEFVKTDLYPLSLMSLRVAVDNRPLLRSLPTI